VTDLAQVKRLTPRELEVLALAAEGMPNDEIGRELGLSVETVRTHLHRVYRKFGVGSRAHAVSQAFRTGQLR
jgi:DNA-binding CsgD family transcriptional regulator